MSSFQKPGVPKSHKKKINTQTENLLIKVQESEPQKQNVLLQLTQNRRNKRSTNKADLGSLNYRNSIILDLVTNILQYILQIRNPQS